VAQTLVTVIWNAAAGGAGHPRLATEVADLLSLAGYEAQIVVPRDLQGSVEAARAAGGRTPIVVAAGGDGTVSSVAAGLIGTPAALGVLPLGTLNHFAKDLGIPLNLEKAVATIAARRVGRIDVGQLNDRTFINNTSIGLYPSIVEAREELRRQGHRKWPAMALATCRVMRHYRGVRVSIEAGGRQAVRRSPFVFVGNNEYAIDGIHLGGRTRLDEGRLFAYLAPRVRTRELPLLLARALVGRARRSGAFEIVSATELWVDTRSARRRRLRVAFDGEVTTMTTPLHYRVCPGALKVILPAA
jgi:diacylglycerol kinase family enzyme